jgi:hypothetical protein
MCTVGPNGKACDGSSGDTGVSGVVQFEQDGEDGPCSISYRVTGLTEGGWVTVGDQPLLLSDRHTDTGVIIPLTSCVCVVARKACMVSTSTSLLTSPTVV